MPKTKRNSTTPSPRATKAPPSLAPQALDDEAVAVTGVREDYATFLPVAKNVDVARVQPFRGDAAVAYFNVLRGIDAVVTARPAIDASGFIVDWDALEQLPRITLGLVYACDQVDATAKPVTSSPHTRAAARVLVDIGLSSADTLVKSGHLKAADVATLRKNCKASDPAATLLKLADFYTTHGTAVRGVCPFGPAQVKDADRIATELMKTTRRRGTKKSVPEALATARANRDCLAALLVERYELLERAAGSRWGRDLVDHVPALFSRVIVKHRKAAKKKPVVDPTATGRSTPKTPD